MLKPWPVTWTAKAKTAPTAMSRRLTPMPMMVISFVAGGDVGAQRPSARIGYAARRLIDRLRVPDDACCMTCRSVDPGARPLLARHPILDPGDGRRRHTAVTTAPRPVPTGDRPRR